MKQKGHLQATGGDGVGGGSAGVTEQTLTRSREGGSPVRALALFGAFARARRPLTLTQLAQALEMPMSSCHQLVHALRKAGYLYRTDSGDFYPTRLIVDVAMAIAAQDPLLERLDPILRQLRDHTAESVVLGKLEGERVLYLAVYEGTQTIRYTSEPGDFRPLHSSATGKAILGMLDEHARGALLDRIALTVMTPMTITDRARLEEDLAASAVSGVYVTRGEDVVDVMAIAVAVPNQPSPMAIAVGGPLDRIEPARARISAALLEARELAGAIQ